MSSLISSRLCVRAECIGCIRVREDRRRERERARATGHERANTVTQSRERKRVIEREAKEMMICRIGVREREEPERHSL